MTSAFILCTAKKGDLTQCLAVADLLGVVVDDVIQSGARNKSFPRWRRRGQQLVWNLTALQFAWKFRRGRILIISNGRSVLPSCRLIKMLRGNNCFILHIGTTKSTDYCFDAILRSEHERDPDIDEESRYDWGPRQIWIDAPICRPIPNNDAANRDIVVLLGGMNTTYHDSPASYENFFGQVDVLRQSSPVSIVFSRRTRKELKAAVVRRFGATNAKLIEAEDQAGFRDACFNAGAFVVSPDSISMVVESCATGRPVYVADLPVRNAKTGNYRFIATALEKGHVKLLGSEVSFERRKPDRPDIDLARRELIAIIDAWRSDPSTISTQVLRRDGSQ